MKTREQLLLAGILTAGIVLALAGYFLFLAEDDQEPGKEEISPDLATIQEETTPEIISEIEGDRGDYFEEALPAEDEENNGVLYGRIRDPDKKSLAGAKVALYRSRTPINFLTKQLKPLYSAETDEKGNYRFEPLYSGPGYRLVVDHDDYMRKALEDIRIKQEEETEAPDLVLLPGKTVYGKVKDENSKPISGAVIAIISHVAQLSRISRKPIPERIARTGEDGSYNIPNLSNSNFHVQASAPGYEIKTMRNTELFTSKTRMEFNFYLAKESILSGIVVDMEEKPIRGATVHSIFMKGKNRPESLTRTDDKGRFVLSGLSEGKYYVTASHELFSSHSIPNMNAGREDLVFILEPRSGIAGQVVNFEGEPITSFWINVLLTSPRTDAWTPYEFRKRFRHKEGRFVIDGVEPGKYTIEAMATGYAPFRSENIEVVREVYTSDLLIKMNVGGSVTGTVLAPDQSPLSRVTVTLRRNDYRPNPVEHFFGAETNIRNPAVKTNKEGFFKIDSIVPGTYQLVFTRSGYSPMYLRDIQIVFNQNSEVPAQIMLSGATLKGRLYNDANVPLGGATLNIRKVDNTFHHSTTTDSKGFFKITAIPAGTYILEPMPNLKETENPFALLGSLVRSQVKNVELMEGQIKEMTLIIYD